MSVITEEELQEIVEVVWMTVLDLPIESGDAAELALSDYVSTQIDITGAWDGQVMVRASEQFLSLAASVMFSCPVDTVNDMDRSDTLTELNNMLGGTVKCLLPETCDLSLPTVLASDHDDGLDHQWVHFSCQGKPLAVAVTPRQATAQKAA